MSAIAATRMIASRDFHPAVLAGAQGGAPAGTAALDRIGRAISLRRGETLFFEGDRAQYCFRVVAGALRSCRLLADGRRHVTRFLRAGDFLGFDSGDVYHATVEAVGDAKVMRYPRRAVDDLLQQEPRLGRTILAKLCEDLSAAHAQMLLLGRKNALERVASFLLAMSGNGDGDKRIQLPMTRSDIADHLGLTIETVSRTFSQLKDLGVIELRASSEVLIRRQEQLEDIAEAA